MNNYKQKIFLLCALLIGCVLTSIGVEFFSKDDEPIQILPPDSLQKAIKKMYCDDIEMDYF
jgi:hypothetical protein